MSLIESVKKFSFREVGGTIRTYLSHNPYDKENFTFVREKSGNLKDLRLSFHFIHYGMFSCLEINRNAKRSKAYSPIVKNARVKPFSSFLSCSPGIVSQYDPHLCWCVAFCYQSKLKDSLSIKSSIYSFILGIRLYYDKMATDDMEAKALSFNGNYIDIYSNSWGPGDLGFEVDGPGNLTQSVLEKGANEVCSRNTLNFKRTWGGNLKLFSVNLFTFYQNATIRLAIFLQVCIYLAEPSSNLIRSYLWSIGGQTHRRCRH